jgi:Rrf2 family protein
MQFTRKGDYALRAMIYLADFPNTFPHTIDEISKNSKVPRHFLAKILKDLTRANLLIAVKGAKGGYRLSRKPSEINLLEIVEATIGPIALNICNEGPGRCSDEDTCILRPVWEKASDAVKGIFGQAKLDTVRSI